MGEEVIDACWRCTIWRQGKVRRRTSLEAVQMEAEEREYPFVVLWPFSIPVLALAKSIVHSLVDCESTSLMHIERQLLPLTVLQSNQTLRLKTESLSTGMTWTTKCVR